MRMSGLSLRTRLADPIFAGAAVLQTPPGATLNSTYTAQWLAAGLALIAAIGRTRRWAAVTAILLSAAGALYIAVASVLRIMGGGAPARWLLVAGALVVIALRPWRAFFSTPTDPLLLVAVQLAVGVATHWVYYQVSGLALDPRSYGT